MAVTFKSNLEAAKKQVGEQLTAIYDKKNESLNLPKLSQNIMEWIDQARPMVGGLTRKWEETPFWIDVYEDNHPNKIIVNGRQTYKSTYATDVFGCTLTSHSNIEAAFVVDRQDRARAWSKQRFRRDTLLQNPVLAPFLPHGRANVDEITLLNGSVGYIRTDEGEYNRVEGLSLYKLLMDECQYHDLQFLTKATYTLAATKGTLEMLGIGGEAGSQWYKFWKKSDQREWVYDDKYWRDSLTFDNRGNINNDPDKLKSTLSGKWVAQAPENHEYRGYHMPQTIFATIPVTIEDAVTKYNTRPQNSIEYQKKHFPLSIYLSHTLGEFFKAERRPITPDMVEAMMTPYRYMSLLTADEVKELKEIFKNRIRVLMGVDFGSGPAASSTVVSIMVFFRDTGRYLLAYINKLPAGSELDQARYLAELGGSYEVDLGVGDLGYGQTQVELIQKGGVDSGGTRYNGMGSGKFKGCRTIGDPSKPTMEYKKEVDDKGEERARFQIDKTTSIQAFIDMVGSYLNHPASPGDESTRRPVIMIPSANDYEIDFLTDDMCSITRKDLDVDQDVSKDDPRQFAKKEFNHPPDSVMSMIYCVVANSNKDSNSFSIRGI